MVLRTNRTTGEKFYGCGFYPDCRGSRGADEHGDPMMTSDESEEALLSWIFDEEEEDD